MITPLSPDKAPSSSPKALLKQKKLPPAGQHAREPLPQRRSQLLADLEVTYREALENGHYAAAIRSKELQGKEMGLFKGDHIPEVPPLARLSDNQLEELIKEAETLLGIKLKAKKRLKASSPPALEE